MKVWMFPGQGSQYIGMGKDLFDSVREFRKLEQQADELLGFSVRKVCTEEPADRLSLTQFTQPCLYTVNALHYYRRMAAESAPTFVAGHSLGEYNALLAGGAFDFLTGLRLVKKRGDVMGKARGGGMAAVIGMRSDRLAKVLEETGLGSLDIANYNSPTQTIISGPLTDIERLQAAMTGTAGVHVVPLPVSAAFHSRYMKEAAATFAAFLAGFGFQKLNVRVMSNVTGEPYPQDATSDVIKTALVRQITDSVRWNSVVRHLLDCGADAFEEVGPGNVLTRLVADIRKDKNATAVAVSNGAAQLPARTPTSIGPRALGSAGFRADYGLEYAYIAGSMYKGIASADMVIAMAKAGMIGFLGTGGMKLEFIDRAINTIQTTLSGGESYGMNLLSDLSRPRLEEETVDLFLRRGVKRIEAAAYMQVSAPLVRFRLRGTTRRPDGSVHCPNSVIAKVSRPEVAKVFMEPAPAMMIDALVAAGALTRSEGELGRLVPVAQEICVEADSGGHTDRGVAYVLMPAMLSLREQMMARYRYAAPIRVGAAGGIGAPEAAAAAFMLGADFILTGSINQCTVEAGTSDLVKSMLQEAEVPDTGYAPAGDMFELGSKVQVFRRGLLFPPRANKLYELYQRHDSLEAIDQKTLSQIEDQYFRRSINAVWDETRAHYMKAQPEEVQRAEDNPKYKMALVFKWYFVHTTRLAMSGEASRRVDFQIHCGPAMGAFNQWVKGTDLERWQNRRVADIAHRLMRGAAEILQRRYEQWVDQRQLAAAQGIGRDHGNARRYS